jgi:hypothetical protein
MSDPTKAAHRAWLRAQYKDAMTTARKKTATDATHNNAIKRAKALKRQLDALSSSGARKGAKRKGRKRKGRRK